MRLVDVDKLIEKWNELSVRGRTEFDQVIMIMPTAFDVDKVVEQLEKLKEWEDVDGKAYYTMSEKQVINKAIKIVERGGIDEEIKS